MVRWNYFTGISVVVFCHAKSNPTASWSGVYVHFYRKITLYGKLKNMFINSFAADLI